MEEDRINWGGAERVAQEIDKVFLVKLQVSVF